MADTPEDRRAAIVASALEGFEREGDAAIDRACADHPDLASAIREGAGALRAVRADAPVLLPRFGPGSRVGRFVLQSEIGRGGMGIVYRAVDPALGRSVALKLLPAAAALSPEAVERFRREARALARIRHPNIVAVLEVGDADGLPYFTMDLVDGESLEAILRRLAGTRPETLRPEQLLPASATAAPPLGARSWVEAVARLFERIADGLEQAHRAGVVHRDVKPGNILVGRDGDPRLVDFGLAREEETVTVTRSGVFPGTPAYMAPEQVRGRAEEVGAAADVFALGVSLHQSLTLRLPFEGASSVEVLQKVLTTNPPRLRRRNPAVPRDLETICEKALDPLPHRRYASAGGFAEDLRNLLALRPIRARPAGPLRRVEKMVRRDPWRATAVGFLSATLLYFGTVEAGRRLGARGALGEASAALRDFRAARIEVQRARSRLAAIQAEMADRFVTPESLAALARAEADVARTDQAAIAASRSLADRLERAGAARPDDPRLVALTAATYREKAREAADRRDPVLAEQWRERAERLDPAAERDELPEGTGSVTIDGAPEGARVFLFRFARRASTVPGVGDRLVPVPFAAGALAPELPPEGSPDAGPFQPGDVTLAVGAVAPGGAGEAAGLRAGDLLVRVAGERIDGTVLAGEVVAGGPAASAGVRPLDRLVAFAGETVRDPFDVEWRWSTRAEGDRVDATFAHAGRRSTISARKGSSIDEDLGVRLVSPEEALETTLPAEGVAVDIVRRDGVRSRTLAGGAPSGLSLETTAYPLQVDDFNDLGAVPLPRVELPPGSYLLLVRAEGFEDLRIPVAVHHGESQKIRADLLVAGTSPPGFVFVPSGPFTRRGDPEARDSAAPAQLHVGAYWIARTEVTVGEYAAFLDDPATRSEITSMALRGELARVPRRVSDILPAWTRGEDGRWSAPWNARWPILRITWEDADAYCRWKTAKARAQGSRFEFALPSEDEWEKAGRGVDGRHFVWGNTFSRFACKMYLTRPTTNLPEPVGRFARDESVYGVRDLQGGALEWCSSLYAGGGNYRTWRGGSWRDANSQTFRLASRNPGNPDLSGDNDGFRIVAHLRDGR